MSNMISEVDFVDIWGAKASPSGDLYDHGDVKDLPLNTVWTVVDTDSGDWIAVPGFCIVNKVGYVVTTRPWADADAETLQAFWFENDLDDDSQD